MRNLKVALVSMFQHSFDGNKLQSFKKAADGLLGISGAMNFECFIYPEAIVEPREAEKARKAAESWGADLLLLHTASYAAGETFLQLTKTNAFIGLWAMAEPQPEDTRQVPLNSLCGINMFAGILTHYLKEYDIPYKWFYGDAEDVSFQRRFSVTVRALTAIVNLRGSRVGLIGGIAPGFNDLYFDERLAERRLGVNIRRNYEFIDIKMLADSYSQSDIQKEIALMQDGFCADGVRCDSLENTARYYKAHMEFVKNEALDAFAMSCWPKMQQLGKGLSCTILGKINQYGVPAACEGDLPAAVSMLLLRYLTQQPTMLMDYIAFDEQDDTVLLWHCGPAAECYCKNSQRKLEYHYHQSPENQYKEVGLVSTMCFDTQPASIFRFTGEWDEAFVASGVFTGQDKDNYKGCRGWYGSMTLGDAPISALDMTNTIMVKGFQHHYPIAPGNLTEELMEICAWLSLDVMEKVPYKNYLQR